MRVRLSESGWNTFPLEIPALALLLLMMFGPGHATPSLAAEPLSDTLIPIKTPKGVTITAELADTPMKRARGLMFREHLADDRGMLFTFGDAQPHTFWMKNTKIPLDIIWMDDKKKIVHIERNVPICTYQDDSCPQYRPNEGALYVLELGGGRADALQLQRGMRLDFKAP